MKQPATSAETDDADSHSGADARARKRAKERDEDGDYESSKEEGFADATSAAQPRQPATSRKQTQRRDAQQSIAAIVFADSHAVPDAKLLHTFPILKKRTLPTVSEVSLPPALTDAIALNLN